VGTIIEFEKIRRALPARRGFQGWSRRFAEDFNEDTCIEDFSDATLMELIQPGDASSAAINEFIMGVKGLGRGTSFHSLDAVDKMAITDIAIFILDQLRFECMRRLAWVETYPGYNTPLLDLVERFSTDYAAHKHETPLLSPSHPRHMEYIAVFEGDRGSFIRRMIPEAIASFEEMIQKG
jgi:hypothetical protein